MSDVTLSIYFRQGQLMQATLHEDDVETFYKKVLEARQAKLSNLLIADYRREAVFLVIDDIVGIKTSEV